MPSRVVLEGPVATVSMDLSIMIGDAPVTPPDTLASPGSAQRYGLDVLQARLASRARKAFDSSEVRVEQPYFTDIEAGSATANVSVVTQDTAKITAAGFAGGVTSLPDELDDPICTYVRELVGGTPPPKVAVRSVEVELGEGALTATSEEGGADGADALSPGEKRAARLISAVMLIPVTVFVLVVLDVDILVAAVISGVMLILITAFVLVELDVFGRI